MAEAAPEPGLADAADVPRGAPGPDPPARPFADRRTDAEAMSHGLLPDAFLGNVQDASGSLRCPRYPETVNPGRGLTMKGDPGFPGAAPTDSGRRHAPLLEGQPERVEHGGQV